VEKKECITGTYCFLTVSCLNPNPGEILFTSFNLPSGVYYLGFSFKRNYSKSRYNCTAMTRDRASIIFIIISKNNVTRWLDKIKKFYFYSKCQQSKSLLLFKGDILYMLTFEPIIITYNNRSVLYVAKHYTF